MLDEFAAEEVDKQSGVTKSGKNIKEKGTGGIWGASSGLPCGDQYGDIGGASRFFFVAKPSDYERQRGLKRFEAKDPSSVTDFRPTLKSNPENWANGTETPYTRTTPIYRQLSLSRYLKWVKADAAFGCY